MTIHCKITEAGVTRRFSIDEDGHAGWRILFAFIGKCNGIEDYKEYGRQKEAETDAILKAAKAAKLEKR